ncbi:hypothetical protein ACFYT4_26660 [Streptomyces sp. NPDC004609]|uniref:hypothetical protein n=1 Tax=Streptomyces sp. NPDC004609 TaxID=3364704 RepID=UPI00369D5744
MAQGPNPAGISRHRALERNRRITPFELLQQPLRVRTNPPIGRQGSMNYLCS